MEKISFHVLIAAAGSGVRFDENLPKQYQLISNKSILKHSIERFTSCKNLKSLHVIINPEHEELYQKAVQDIEYDLPPPLYGGNERNISIYNALKGLSDVKDDEVLLIHDAVRPCITKQRILEVVNSAHNNKAASLACPMTDSICDKKSGAYLDRDKILSIQTPQGFHFGILKKAHEEHHEKTQPKEETNQAEAGFSMPITDDCSLVKALGYDIAYVTGDRENIKITHKEDLELAKILMNKNMAHNVIVKTGYGYDVHAFDKASKGPLRLCGIDIEHPHPLKGHSDADVGIHALCDALLSALGLGDIGEHFPPSDESYKNKDSHFFLAEVLKKLENKNASINNVGITIVCEEPKVGPFRKKMVQNISAQII